MSSVPQQSFSVTAGGEPIKLGSMLLTVVEPHRGHEVAYNRWYERDHFYAGCMIGAYQFAGRRFVATAPLKSLRPDGTEVITGEKEKGSYVGCYFVLDGHHDYWNQWAVAQVHQLHAQGRMFEHRDHVHTLLYDFQFEARREADGVPVELALDHPYGGFVPVWIDRKGDGGNDELWSWLVNDLFPSVLPGTAAGLVAGFTPQALRDDAPSDVPRAAASDERTMLLFFLDQSPLDCYDQTIGVFAEKLKASGRAEMVAALPFIPTIPGTDRYTDELWSTK